MENLSGEALLAEMEQSGLRQKEFWRQRYADTLTFDQMHGRIWRARQKWMDRSALFHFDLGQPLHLTGDWMIIGDVQLPTTDYDFAALPAAIAKKYLKKPRQLLIAGDLMNMDAFGAYEAEIGLPGFRQEIEAARVLLDEWFRVFDRIVYTPGNHERRLSKRTSGAILMEDLIRIINARVETSNFDRVIIETPTGLWLVPHGSDYSVTQLSVSDVLAQKYRMNIISLHQHHIAMGWDRFGHNVVIDGGGLFNEAAMAYVQLDSSKRPRMKNGFTMLLGGYPYLFSRAPMTDYSFWLG